jgi:DeoR family transcriptional regulator of aga operon
LPEVSTTRSILAMQAELVILADHSKLGRAAAARVAPLARIHTLVSDAPGDPALLEDFRARGVRVLLAP